MEHFVPFALSFQPALQLQEPSVWHFPLTQLQLWVKPLGLRHNPDPLIPSSHISQSEGHAWHSLPKNPDWQASHDEPVNPGRHAQDLCEVHIPPLVHAVLQEALCSWERITSDEKGTGNCSVSGDASQKITRLFDMSISTQVFGDIMNEGESIELVILEALAVVGSSM